MFNCAYFQNPNMRQWKSLMHDSDHPIKHPGYLDV